MSKEVYEAKKRFVENELEAVLKEAFSFGAKIKRVWYHNFASVDREEVIVELEPYSEGEEGRNIVIDITADSLSAILIDVVRVMQDKY